MPSEDVSASWSMMTSFLPADVETAFAYAPVISYLPEWFVRRRGLANGIFFCGKPSRCLYTDTAVYLNEGLMCCRSWLSWDFAPCNIPAAHQEVRGHGDRTRICVDLIHWDDTCPAIRETASSGISCPWPQSSGPKQP